MSEAKEGRMEARDFFFLQATTNGLPAAALSPLLGKDFECVQRIFALAGEWQAGIHVLTRIASRGAAVAAKQLLVMEGTAASAVSRGRPLR